MGEEIKYKNLHRYDKLRAERILGEFTRTEIYMRSLISGVTGNGSYTDGLNYSELIRESMKILGVLRKIAYSEKLEDSVLTTEISQNKESPRKQLKLF